MNTPSVSPRATDSRLHLLLLRSLPDGEHLDDVFDADRHCICADLGLDCPRKYLVIVSSR